MEQRCESRHPHHKLRHMLLLPAGAYPSEQEYTRPRDRGCVSKRLQKQSLLNSPWHLPRLQATASTASKPVQSTAVGSSGHPPHAAETVSETAWLCASVFGLDSPLISDITSTHSQTALRPGTAQAFCDGRQSISEGMIRP